MDFATTENSVTPRRERRGMCLRCDGYSEDDVHRVIDLNIRVHGFHIVGVDDVRPWTYTIGVNDSKGHPDLVVMDTDMKAAGRLLWWLYDRIEAGGRIDPAVLAAEGVELVRVDHRYLVSDLFGGWSNFYERCPRPGEILQVLPPPWFFCATHQHRYRRLDRPRGRRPPEQTRR